MSSVPVHSFSDDERKASSSVICAERNVNENWKSLEMANKSYSNAVHDLFTHYSHLFSRCTTLCKGLKLESTTYGVQGISRGAGSGVLVPQKHVLQKSLKSTMPISKLFLGDGSATNLNIVWTFRVKVASSGHAPMTFSVRNPSETFPTHFYKGSERDFALEVLTACYCIHGKHNRNKDGHAHGDWTKAVVCALAAVDECDGVLCKNVVRSDLNGCTVTISETGPVFNFNGSGVPGEFANAGMHELRRKNKVARKVIRTCQARSRILNVEFHTSGEYGGFSVEVCPTLEDMQLGIEDVSTQIVDKDVKNVIVDSRDVVKVNLHPVKDHAKNGTNHVPVHWTSLQMDEALVSRISELQFDIIKTKYGNDVAAMANPSMQSFNSVHSTDIKMYDWVLCNVKWIVAIKGSKDTKTIFLNTRYSLSRSRHYKEVHLTIDPKDRANIVRKAIEETTKASQKNKSVTVKGDHLKMYPAHANRPTVHGGSATIEQLNEAASIQALQGFEEAVQKKKQSLARGMDFQGLNLNSILGAAERVFN